LILVIILIVIAAAYFFWPKPCGSWSSLPRSININCECIGIMAAHPHFIFPFIGWGFSEGAGKYWCSGIPTNKYHCYNSTMTPSGWIKTEVNCLEVFAEQK